MKKANCPRCKSELLIKKEVEKSKLIRCPKCKKEFLNELFYVKTTPKTVAKKTPKTKTNSKDLDLNYDKNKKEKLVKTKENNSSHSINLVEEIIKTIDNELIERNKKYTSLGHANKILLEERIISKIDKSKQLLKKLLEDGEISNSSQTIEKPRQWRIFLSDEGKLKKILYKKKKKEELIESRKNRTSQQISNESGTPIKLKYWIFAIFGLWVMYTIMTNKTVHSKVKNSEWNGSVIQVERYLKETLKDPKSLEIIQWSRVYDMKHSQYGYRYKVRVKYRAKNSFGGYVIESDLFYLDENGEIVKVE